MMDKSGISTITLSTHNLNGYARSKEFLLSQCVSCPNSIRAVQEHWLRPPYKKQMGVNQMRHLHLDFDGYGFSAMKSSIESKISIGRPYGGTGFLYNKKYSKCLRPLLDYQHERVTVLEINTTTDRILFINAYMPYYNVRDVDGHLAMYRDVVGFIDHIVSCNLNSKIIVAADFNCNLFDESHPFSKLFHDLMKRYALVSALCLDPHFNHQTSFTRYDNKTKSYTLLDGFLISESLKGMIDNVRISHDGNNVSDHIPVELDLHVSIDETVNVKPRMRPFINWRKLSDEHMSLFQEKMVESLSSIEIPPHSVFHGNHCCGDDSHKVVIENYYCDIVKSVVYAESFLPKANPNYQRSFWNEELSELKHDS